MAPPSNHNRVILCHLHKTMQGPSRVLHEIVIKPNNTLCIPTTSLTYEKSGRMLSCASWHQEAYNHQTSTNKIPIETFGKPYEHLRNSFCTSHGLLKWPPYPPPSMKSKPSISCYSKVSMEYGLCHNHKPFNI